MSFFLAFATCVFAVCAIFILAAAGSFHETEHESENAAWVYGCIFLGIAIVLAYASGRTS
jgi:hypothetical protein